MFIAWCSYSHKSIGRHNTMGIRKFLYATLALLLSFSALAAAPGAQRSQKDKDKGKDASQTGAQCAPGTGSPGAQTALSRGEDIIRQFAQHESEFKIERGNYTYTQTLLVQDSDPGGGGETGEYNLTSEIVFTPQGKRYEKVTYAPPPTLHIINLTPEDMQDLQDVQPFVLTTEDLPKYDVQFSGQERLDELNTYKFCVGPKRIEKNQRYFQGTLWVDSRDLAVVKSEGKAVPNIVNGKRQIFPLFVTYRENIEGNFWFPTYTHADQSFHDPKGEFQDVRVRMTVRYKNYKRFGSTIQLGKSTEVPGTPSNQPPTQPAPNK